MTEEEWDQGVDPRRMLGFLRDRGPRDQPTLRDLGRVGDRETRLFAAACCRRLWPLLTDERSRSGVEGAERCGEDPATARAMAALHRAAGEVDLPEPHDEVNTARAQAWLASGADPRSATRWRIILAAHYAAHAAYCAAAAAEYACRVWRGEVQGEWDKRMTHRSVVLCGEKTADSAAIAATVWSDDVDASLVAAWLLAEPGDQEVLNAFKAACQPARGVQAELLRDIVGSPFRESPAIAPAILADRDARISRLARSIRDSQDFGRLPLLADALEAAGCTDPVLLAHCRGPGPHVRGCWVLEHVQGV
jgi:hypothetical protein